MCSRPTARRGLTPLLGFMVITTVTACGEEQVAEPIPDRPPFSMDALVPYDAGAPDLLAPDTLRPDAAQPDRATATDAARPDTLTAADAARPDALIVADAARPDTLGAADAALPDSATGSDAAQPDAALPDTALPDTLQPDTLLPDTSLPDTALPDTAALDDAAGPDSGDPCDQDGDGVQNSGCGGNDCDDGNALRFPGNPEICSFTDENCSGANNEGLECWFFAVSGETLYRVDPFEREVVFVTDVTLPRSEDIVLLDIDVDTNGDLIAVTYDRVYTLHETGYMTTLYTPTLPTSPNGLSITASGLLYLSTNDATDPSYIQQLDRSTEVLTPRVALLPHSSSGDLIVFDDGFGLVTSPDPVDPNDGFDRLVAIDVDDGSKVELGNIGYQDVWALSYSFGYIFALTGNGEVLLIHPGTGEGIGLFAVIDGDGQRIPFYGAANAE